MANECEVCLHSLAVTLSCSQCKVAFYCSVDHQKKHWYVHKFQCAYYTSLITLPATPVINVIIQPDLTDEELRFFMVSRNLKVDSKLLGGKFRAEPCGDKEFAMRKITTETLLENTNALTRSVQISALRARGFKEALQCFESATTRKFRYLRPYYRIASVTMDRIEKKIKFISEFDSQLFKMYTLYYAVKDLPELATTTSPTTTTTTRREDERKYSQNDLDNLKLVQSVILMMRSSLAKYEEDKGSNQAFASRQDQSSSRTNREIHP